MAQLTVSDMTYDFDEFVSQLEVAATTTDGPWLGTLDTMTSKTLIDTASAVGAYLQTQINFAIQDNFPDTAQSDEAIRANTQYQGVRMTRKLPAGVVVSVSSTVDIIVPQFSQWTLGGLYFNRDSITLKANVAQSITLFQGQVKQFNVTGSGNDFQTLVLPDTDFTVSDSDVVVSANGVNIQRATNQALWNYRGQLAYADVTNDIGRALLAFGSSTFGYVPSVNDQITVTYVVTNGASGNSQVLVGTRLSVAGFPTVSGQATQNPTGGADERQASDYKTVIAGAFGTYASAATGNQYKSTVLDYPGIVDATTQAQRDINPGSKHWMNVIRVAALTSSPWTLAQKQAYCEYLQGVTMYAPRFLWQDPIPLPRALSMDVYVFNTASIPTVKANITTALQQFFAPRRGLLGRDFHATDTAAVVRAACGGQFDYMDDYSSYPMSASLPAAPALSYEVIAGDGTLQQLQYAYAVSVDILTDAGTLQIGTPSNWVFPVVQTNGSGIKLIWNAVAKAQNYHLWGRSTDKLGLLATLSPTVTEWLDDGSVQVQGSLPPSANEWPIQYNTMYALTLNVYPSQRPKG